MNDESRIMEAINWLKRINSRLWVGYCKAVGRNETTEIETYDASLECVELIKLQMDVVIHAQSRRRLRMQNAFHLIANRRAER